MNLDSSLVGPSCSITSPTTKTKTVSTSGQAKIPTKSPSSSHKRPFNNNSVVKDPQTIAEELARKRARNTDAARRSRQRKSMRMDSLEKQVVELTIENNELKTRLTVLEVEKK
ncbi:4450_t:CDS:2, partial [Funneliformis mosseae]